MTIKNVRYCFFNVFDNDFLLEKMETIYFWGDFFGIVNMYDKK